MKRYFTKKMVDGVSWVVSSTLLSQNDIPNEYLFNKLKYINSLDLKEIQRSNQLDINKNQLAIGAVKSDFVLLKSGRRKFFGFTNILDESGTLDAFVKVFHCSSLVLKLKHMFVCSKARREFALAHMINELGIPALFAIAAGEKRRFGILEKSYLIVKKVDNVSNLKEFFCDEEHTPKERHKVMKLFGETARLSHDKGVLQTDFALNNFLVQKLPDGEFKVILIDYERTELHSKIVTSKRFWILTKLNRSGMTFSANDKLRFLKSYMNAGESVDKTKEMKQTLKTMAVSLDREAVTMLRAGVVRVQQGSIKGDRKFVVYRDIDYKGHFLKKYNVKSMLDQIRNFNNLKDVLTVECGALEVKSSLVLLKSDTDNEQAYRIFKFTGLDSKKPYIIWQNANALLKGWVNVFLPVGVFVTDREAYLITSYKVESRDIKDYVNSVNESDKRCTFLYKLARFVSYLHNFGRLMVDILPNDIVVVSNNKALTIYFSHTYNFVFDISLTHDERAIDINRVTDYLEGSVTDEEIAFFKKIYSKNEEWYCEFV